MYVAMSIFLRPGSLPSDRENKNQLQKLANDARKVKNAQDMLAHGL